MTKSLTQCLIAGAIAVALPLSTATVSEAQTQKAAAAPTVTGTWNMSLLGDHVIPVGLVLEQSGKKVTGTLMIMGKDVPLDGEYVDGALTVTGAASIDSHDGASPASAPVPMKLTATMKDDGTLAGEIGMSRGPMKWTAERMRDRTQGGRPAPKAAATLTGAWTIAVQGAQGVMALPLMLKQDGSRVSGTITMMGADVPFDGAFADSTLVFATTSGEGASLIHIEYSAKTKDDGTLAGTLSGTMGKMSWTAERVKK